MKRTLLCSCELSERCISGLESYGYAVMTMPPSDLLPLPVSSHPDMLTFKIGDSLLLNNDYYSKNQSFFDALPCNIILTQENFTDKYPGDVLFNAFSLGNKLYGRMSSLSKHIKSFYKQHINIKQGYAKCSTCIIDDNSVITADLSVAHAVNNNGGEALITMPGHIALKGYNYGFIGGASGKVDENTVVFFGDVSAHPDYDKMIGFAGNREVKLISLSDEQLEDTGGFIIL